MSMLYFPGLTFLCAGEFRKLRELYHRFSVRSISEIRLHGNLYYITVSQFLRRCSGVQKFYFCIPSQKRPILMR